MIWDKEPTSALEALSHDPWKLAMQVKMDTIEKHGTWELVSIGIQDQVHRSVIAQNWKSTNLDLWPRAMPSG